MAPAWSTSVVVASGALVLAATHLARAFPDVLKVVV